jgi:cytochrome c biogenesis protein CcmG, thiol:disulfide interchange protein DsbE
LPGLEQLQKQFGNDAVVLGVNVAEDPSKVKSHYTQKKISWQVLLDTEARVAEVYGVDGFPTYFFINKEGKIHRTIIGTAEMSYIGDELGKLK